MLIYSIPSFSKVSLGSGKNLVFIYCSYFSLVFTITLLIFLVLNFGDVKGPIQLFLIDNMLKAIMLVSNCFCQCTCIDEDQTFSTICRERGMQRPFCSFRITVLQVQKRSTLYIFHISRNVLQNLCQHIYLRY